MNSLELLKIGGISEKEADEMLELAIDTCSESARLNRELLSYSRRQNLNPSAISMDMIEGYLHEFNESLGSQKMELLIDIQTQKKISADPLYFRSSLGNIMRNAADATKAHNSRFNIVIEDGEEEQVMITLWDNGPGFSKSEITSATQPFFSTKSHGTGLGLATVEGFVRQSQGTLSLTNRESGGACIEICLPTAHNERPKSISSLQKSKPKRHQKILLIEDNLELGRLIRSYLRPPEYKIMLATNIIETIEIAEKSEKFDVILTDVRLGSETCFDIMDQLILHSPEARRIYVTGYGTEHFTERLQRFPGEIVEKPFKMETLRQMI